MTRTSFSQPLASIAACLAMLIQPAVADAAASGVDKLLAANKWKEAAQAIFLEANATDRYESAVIVGQAKGGFVKDALESISRTPPNNWSWHFLSLANDASAISQDMRSHFVQKSLDAARNQTGDSVNYVKSYSLISIALYLSKNGANNEARAIFSEALATAENGLTEKGSGGFRNITEAMKGASPEAVRDWMLAPLKEKIDKTTESENQAFACIDMVSVSGGLGKTEQASAFIECAKKAIGKVNDRSKRKLADERLAVAAQSAGVIFAGVSASPYYEAIEEARSGNAKKSYDIVTGLNSNLYVDHRVSAFNEVLNDALTRNDLKTAHFFAQRPLRKGVSQEVGVWQKIAEKEVALGDRKSAGESYARAASALERIDSRYYVADALIFLHLADSMIRNGLEDEGRQVTLSSLPLFEGLADKRRKDDLVNASVAEATSLWKIGMRPEAKTFLRQAYQLASTYDVSKVSSASSEKSRLLASVGSATLTFLPKVSLSQRVNQKN